MLPVVLCCSPATLRSPPLKIFGATNLEAFCPSCLMAYWISLCGTFSPACSHYERWLKIATLSSISWLTWCSYSSKRLCYIAINSDLGSYSAMTTIYLVSLLAKHSFALRYSLFGCMNGLSLNGYQINCAIQAKMCQNWILVTSGVTKRSLHMWCNLK